MDTMHCKYVIIYCWRDCLQIKFYTDIIVFAYTYVDALLYF